MNKLHILRLLVAWLLYSFAFCLMDMPIWKELSVGMLFMIGGIIQDE